MKSKLMQFFGFVLGIALLTTTATAQVSSGGTPPSQTLTNLSAVTTVTMAPVDAADYLAEDKDQPKDMPLRFGIMFDVVLNLEKSGVWTDLPNGDRLWRLRIKSNKAYSINLIYDQFHMPDGGKFYLYNNDYRFVIGAFTDFNNKADGMFATQPVPDDAITLEYYEPANVRGEGVISVMQVVHGYRNVFGYREPGDNLDSFGDSGTCNNNVACDSEWDDQERGVVKLIVSPYVCTGSLINNVNNDGTPYILTANHCDPGPTDMAIFNYQSPTCTPNQDGSSSQSVSNGTVRFTTSTNTSSDCSLWELSVDVPLAYNPFFNGWNAVNSAAASSVCIHHPSGDTKKISWDNNAYSSTEYLSSSVNSSQDHWRITDWDDGTTEGGSSGSPLFDPNYRIVGQLHGGYAACGNNDDDWYGKLSYSMTSGLRSWLDPSTTGAMTLDGYDPNVVAQSITVTSPNTAVTWVVGDVNAITWTSTGLSENVQIHINRSYPGGAWETITSSTSDDGSYNWTVTSATTSNARIRVRGTTTTAVSDESNTNFTIAEPTITVINPNTAVTWIDGMTETIQWSSTNLTGNVKIELNRSYSGGAWETIISNTTNDGAHNWTVSTPTTSSARIRVSSVSYPSISDVSNTNFTIADRSITVTTPNTALTWIEDADHFLEWTSQNITGNVSIEINRSYPGGAWESIVSSTTDDGSYEWSVLPPTTSSARIRVTSLSYPSISDISDVNFSIVAANTAPTLTHDRLDDHAIGGINVTAHVNDDASGFITRLFIREAGTVDYDSTQLNSTLNGDEYAAAIGKSTGSYEYFLRVIDAGGLTAATPVLTFDVQGFFGLEQAYDDGSSEASHWSETIEMKWAVKFDAGSDSYVLSNARVGVSAENPTADYSELEVSLYLADGAGGLPGTLVTTKSVGSLGNVIGGVPTAQDNWVNVVFFDEFYNPPILTSDFYIVVSNPSADSYDAFLHDENGMLAGRSVVYDFCEDLWIDETTIHESTRSGNRMIRVSGFALTPLEIVASLSGTDIQLDWEDTGAPYYKIYSSINSDGPFTNLEGSVQTSSFIDSGPFTNEIKFYIVQSSTQP